MDDEQKKQRMDEKTLQKEIGAQIRCFNDFPTKGVLFRDILPLFKRPDLVSSLCSYIADTYRGSIDAVAALEARGFLFGPIVALELDVPFVPIRKKGKLPGPICSINYIKEYGQDTLEIQMGTISKGQQILLFDDLLATGGSLCAAVQLIKKVEADVRAIFVIVELDGLNGRKQLGESANITKALLNYS